MRALRRGATWILLAGLSAVTLLARAGDMGEGDEEQQRAARVARAWRRQGIAALPRAWDALHSDDAWLQGEARDVLRGWGAQAVGPLLLRASRMHDDGEPVEIVAKILCWAGRPGGGDGGDDGNDGDGTSRSAARRPARAEARAAQALAAAERPLLRALARGRGSLADTGVDVVASVTSMDSCPNRALVAARAAPATVALVLEKKPTELRAEHVALLAGLGPGAAPALPHAIRWLDDPHLRAASMELLGAIGAPALRALPDLTARLAAMSRDGCAADNRLAAVAAHAVGALGGAGDAGAPSAIAALQAMLRACPAIESEVVAAIGRMGPRGAAASPDVRAILRDRARTSELRSRAIHTLRQLAVPPDATDRAIEAALEKKEEIRWRMRSGLPIGPQVQASDPQVSVTDLLRPAAAGSPAKIDHQRANRAAAAMAQEAAICRTEVGLDPPPEAFTRALAAGPDAAALEALSDCLRKHACGPTPTDRDVILGVCCRRAFVAAPPAWCSGG